MTPAEPIRLVIVDDHPAIVHGIAGLLAAAPDIEVIDVAADGAAGLDLVARTRPDVLLLDIDLPDRDGFSVAGDALEVLPELAIVIYTGRVDAAARTRAASIGAAAILSKMDDVDGLADTVRGAAARTLPRLRVSAEVPQLTGREAEVLDAMGRGLSNAEIADELHLATNTVRNYVARVLDRLGAHSKLEAVSVARELGLLR